MLDRFLVITEKQKIPAVIIANKTDLVDNAKELFRVHESIGYRVIYTSTKTSTGLDEPKAQLQEQDQRTGRTERWGKSSLLNEVQAGLGLAVNEISYAMKKQAHHRDPPDVRTRWRRICGGYARAGKSPRAVGY